MIQIGILGLGYVSSRLLNKGKWASNSWAAGRGAPGPQWPYGWSNFDWRKPQSWDQLPAKADALLLSIPPLYPQVSEEAAHLHQWGEWVNRNRPGFKKWVYLSSTSVFPNQAGCYSEDTPPSPDQLKGRLRQTTEEILSQYFPLTVIRPAAIYGPGRGIASRIKRGLPIASDSGPVYRIHVDDLIRVCELAICEPHFPSLVHAADLCPASSLEVAQWLLQQPGYSKLSLNLEAGYLARRGFGSHPKREIQCLQLNKWGFCYLYPSYREGLLDHESAQE